MTAVATRTEDQLAVPETPAALSPAPPIRRHVAMTGAMFAIAAGVMLVGGELAAYFGARQAVQHTGGTWLPSSVTLPNMALAVTYVSLLMSSFTAQWAVSAIRAADRRQSLVASGLTLLLAGAFLNGMTFCWAQLGMKAGDGGFGDAVYTLTVTHVLLVVVAIVAFVVTAFRVLGGQFGPRNSELVAATAAFWHFAVAAGVAIWWCVWFLEGGPGK